jgi:hypothetical protein
VKILKNDEEEAKKRINAWWEGEILDRPPVILTAPRTSAEKYDGPDTDNLDDWWTNPNYVLPRLKHQLLNTAWLGEAFPKVHPMSVGMVAILAQYLGAKNSYIDKSTTWSGETIDDWKKRGKIEITEDNEFWVKTKKLMNATVDMIKKEGLKAYIGIPDLNGPTEVLSGLRNPQKFSLDIYDCPEEITAAFRETQDAWFKAYEWTSAKAHELGGWFTWLSLWSDIPCVDLQSDVSCLVSPDQFKELFLPFIREQTERIPRTIYHLDGPDAVRHTEALLDLPELDAIQWEPGAGDRPMIKWVDHIRRIQEGGKRVWLGCNSWEIEPLLRELNPEGLLFITHTAGEEEGHHLLDYIGKNWKNW